MALGHRLAGKNLDDCALACMETALADIAEDISCVFQFQARQFHP